MFFVIHQANVFWSVLRAFHKVYQPLLASMCGVADDGLYFAAGTFCMMANEGCVALLVAQYGLE